jgi:hypothetical protein
MPHWIPRGVVIDHQPVKLEVNALAGGKLRCEWMDLTDEQWKVVDTILPADRVRADGRGRPWSGFGLSGMRERTRKNRPVA